MRLAYERGFLTQKSLNHFQQWTLLYWLYMSRRNELEDINDQMERQTYNLAPEQWALLYKDKILGPTADELGEIPVGEDDLDEMDAFFAAQEAAFQDTLSGTHKMSGGATPEDWRDTIKNASEDDWGAWQ